MIDKQDVALFAKRVAIIGIVEGIEGIRCVLNYLEEKGCKHALSLANGTQDEYKVFELFLVYESLNHFQDDWQDMAREIITTNPHKKAYDQ